MKRILFTCTLILAALCSSASACAQQPAPTFAVEGGHFLLNGKPFQGRLRRAALRPHPAQVLARPPEDGGKRWVSTPSPPTSSGTSTNPRPVTSTSPARTTSPPSSRPPRKKAFTSSSAPALTPAPSGSSAAFPPGSSKTPRCTLLSARTTTPSWFPPNAG